jgi:hypothetical protein
MKIAVINRKYNVGGKLIRFRKMGNHGFLIAVFKYEFRFYKK